MSAAVALGALDRNRRERRMRAASTTGILTAVGVALAITALAVGSVAIAPAEVIAALAGTADGGAQFIVRELRLPRLTLALVVGAALGMAGALLQSVVRNPLASPDIVGVTGGASAAAVLAIGTGATGLAVTGSALVGATVAIVLVLAASGRQLGGTRIVVVGIAVAFLAQGVLGYALTRARLEQAGTAYFWLVGSVGSPSAPETLTLGMLVLVAGIGTVLGRGALAAQLLGDETARAVGSRPRRTRILAVTASTVLAAVSVAVAGPLAFVAFVAGPIARRLRGGAPAVLTAALVGAVLVLASDLVAQNLIPGPLQPPAGLITGAVGAPLLVWLLIRAARQEGRA